MTTRQLARFEPFEMSPFGLTFGGLFDDAWGRSGEDGDRMLAPPIDVVEDEDSLTISAELPGLKKEDVHVQVENGVLEITGEKRSSHDEKAANWHRLERHYGSFRRALSLPRGVNADEAQVTFENGVLAIRLPKREDVKPKTLPIR